MMNFLPISIYNDDERSLESLWGRDYSYYGSNPIKDHISNSTSTSNDGGDQSHLSQIHFYRGILGFAITLVFYCCVLRCLCGDAKGATKRDVDKSLIKKVVLPHGLSQSFPGDESCAPDDDDVKLLQCCCRRKRKGAVAPAGDTAEEILETYRYKSRGQQKLCLNCNSVNADNEGNAGKDKTTNNEKQPRADSPSDLGLVLAEEGLGASSDSMVCSICIEPFRVGEQVAWSKLGHCRHVFHYECILPWAVIGHEECPVCRAAFWRRDMPCSCTCVPTKYQRGNSASTRMRQSRFCVQHGLVLPSTNGIENSDS
ncbi:hypothetical protein ACHAWF_005380 [Thalassiosira exigua]